MSAHAKVYINVDNTGIASMNNWMPDAIKSVEEWLFDMGFDINGLGADNADKGNGPKYSDGKERYWVEAESTSCSYEVFDHDYISRVLDGWCEEFKDLRFEYSVYNLDIEPDIFMTRESIGGRPLGYDSRG